MSKVYLRSTFLLDIRLLSKDKLHSTSITKYNFIHKMAEGDSQNMAKTLQLKGIGGYDKVKVVMQEKPKPGKGEVLVNIKANGINFAELMMRQGTYTNSPKLPFVMGLEGSGVVVGAGEGVETLKEGDRILCMKSSGLWSEYVNVPENFCFKMPESMTFEEGAAIPVNYVTAHMMLFDFGNLRPKKSVLIHMAAGGVGIAATQLCKSVPNVTVFGTSSAAKHEVIKTHGCTHPIDYRTKDYVTEIKKIQPEGVDIVLDPLNGHDAVKGYNLLKPMGKIIHFGAANVVTGPSRSLTQVAKTWWATKSHNSFTMVGENKSIAGYHLGLLVESPELIRDCMLELIELYNQGKIKPKIDSVWSYEDVGKGMARMHERKNIGKVIITPHKPAGENVDSGSGGTSETGNPDEKTAM